MQVIKNNELFTQVAAEESAIASGGNLVDAAAFGFLSISPASYGGTTFTAQELILQIGILSRP